MLRSGLERSLLPECSTNSRGDMCLPWQLHTSQTWGTCWCDVVMYMNPKMVLPLGPRPVVVTLRHEEDEEDDDSRLAGRDMAGESSWPWRATG